MDAWTTNPMPRIQQIPDSPRIIRDHDASGDRPYKGA